MKHWGAVIKINRASSAIICHIFTSLKNTSFFSWSYNSKDWIKSLKESDSTGHLLLHSSHVNATFVGSAFINRNVWSFQWFFFRCTSKRSAQCKQHYKDVFKKALFLCIICTCEQRGSYNIYYCFAVLHSGSLC